MELWNDTGYLFGRLIVKVFVSGFVAPVSEIKPSFRRPDQPVFCCSAYDIGEQHLSDLSGRQNVIGDIPTYGIDRLPVGEFKTLDHSRKKSVMFKTFISTAAYSSMNWPRRALARSKASMLICRREIIGVRQGDYIATTRVSSTCGKATPLHFYRGGADLSIPGLGGQRNRIATTS